MRTLKLGVRSGGRSLAAAAGLVASLAAVALAQPVTSTTTTTVTTTTTGPVQTIVPPVRWRPPPLPVHPPRPDWPMPVRMTAVNASVTIDEQVGTTSIELTLHNPSGRQQEAEVILPVPEGVAVRSFGYDGVGPEFNARLLPKDEARRIYESIVNRERDPGLLEFVGYNMIKSSVFPVPAGGTQKVRLVYEQVLPSDGGRVDYVLPRSESGTSGSSAAGGTPAPLEAPQWTMSVSIRSKRGISTVYSPSHELVTERLAPGQVNVRVPATLAMTPGSLRLSYLTEKSGGDGVNATVVAYPDPSVGDGKGGYFLLLGGLPATPAREQALKREVVLVIDRSGSMRGQKIEQVRAAALQVVEGLEMGEAFNIIDYSDSIQSFADKPVIKSAETVEAARKYIRAMQAGGGTNIHDSLLEALRQPPTAGMLPMVLFLTDGLPTVGERSEVKIREAAKTANAANRRIFTFGVGFDVNGPLLTNLARTSRAAGTFVLPEEDVEVKVSQVFRRLSGPVMATPKLIAASTVAEPKVGGTRIREVQAGNGGAELQDLFDGDQLVVLGEYSGDEPMKLKLEGSYLGKPRTFEYEFDPKNASMRNGYVPRLWAGRKIAALLDEIRQAGANGNAATDPRTKELVDEIVRLSTKFGILTEYTAFLATEPSMATRGQSAGGGGGGVPATAAVPMEAARDVTFTNIGKLKQERAGRLGVAQDMNVQQQVESAGLWAQNCYVAGDNMQQVRIGGVQQVADVACFNRGGRWVDARLLAKEQEKPDKTVEFGTPEYSKCVDDLVKENRQGMLAFSGDVYLMVNGERVLFKNP